MKKTIITAFLILSLCLSFAACGEDKDDNKNPVDSTVADGSDEKGDTPEVNGTFPDLKGVVDSVKEYYGENLTFVFMEDEYSDEVLMYTYGLYDDKYVDAVSNFVLTECDGMSADTFAVITFKSGTDKKLIEEAAGVMEEEYITALKNKLAAYNPDEFKASDGYKLKIYDDAVMMVISSKNADAILAAAGK